jgi:hypothetical protein
VKCAIMQPTYLPWSGYFNLIASVERFVFLDNVQFERQSWQSRNRILLDGKEHVLVVPVHRATLSTQIKDVQISQARGHWRRTHWMTLRSGYAKAPYGSQLLALLEPLYTGEEETSLSLWNQAIITRLAEALNLPARFLRASALDYPGERSERLLALCQELGAHTYLSPRGSADYLEADGFALQDRVKLEFQSFQPAPYPQYRSGQFASHLSIVDLIANTGLDYARAYVSEPV